MDKIATNRVIKIGIVTSDVEATARELESLFDTVPAYDHYEPEFAPGEYGPEDKYRLYRGEVADSIHMKVKVVNVEPVYFELIQPVGEAKSPWHDFLREKGTGVCFISFYVNGFRQHIDLMEAKGIPVVFEEEKGFERYAYFDTLKSLGFLLEMKERVANTPKGKE